MLWECFLVWAVEGGYWGGCFVLFLHFGAGLSVCGAGFGCKVFGWFGLGGGLVLGRGWRS